jgi:hypothetical protein
VKLSWQNPRNAINYDFEIKERNRMWSFGGKWVCLFAALFLLSGCGEAVSSGVEIVSDPPEAAVRIGAEMIGKTPVLIPRKTFKDHSLDTFTLLISKKGYKEKQIIITQERGTLSVRLEKE